MTTTKFYPRFSNKLQKAIYEKSQLEINKELEVGTQPQMLIFNRSKKLSALVKRFLSQRFSQYTNIEISQIVKETVTNNVVLSNKEILEVLETRLKNLTNKDLKSGSRCIESNTEESKKLRELFKNTVKEYSLSPITSTILKRLFEEYTFINDDVNKSVLLSCIEDSKNKSDLIYNLIGTELPKRVSDCLMSKSYEFVKTNDFELIKLLTLMIVYETTNEEYCSTFIKRVKNSDFRIRIKDVIDTNWLNRFDAKLLNKYLFYCELFDIKITEDVEKYIVEKSKLRTKLLIEALNEMFNIDFTNTFKFTCSRKVKDLVYSKMFLDDKRFVKHVLKEIQLNDLLNIK